MKRARCQNKRRNKLQKEWAYLMIANWFEAIERKNNGNSLWQEYFLSFFIFVAFLLPPFYSTVFFFAHRPSGTNILYFFKYTLQKFTKQIRSIKKESFDWMKRNDEIRTIVDEKKKEKTAPSISIGNNFLLQTRMVFVLVLNCDIVHTYRQITGS